MNINIEQATTDPTLCYTNWCMPNWDSVQGPNLLQDQHMHLLGLQNLELLNACASLWP